MLKEDWNKNWSLFVSKEGLTQPLATSGDIFLWTAIGQGANQLWPLEM